MCSYVPGASDSALMLTMCALQMFVLFFYLGRYIREEGKN